MKILICCSLLILTQSIFVQCSVMDVIQSKLNEFTGYISKTFKNLGDNIKSFFDPTTKSNIAKYQPIFVDRPVTNLKMLLKDLAIVNAGEKNINKTDGPELLLATTQLALWHGRDIESHVVRTKDGYFLTVHRITANVNLQANRTVLLHHGLLGSSTDWILLGPIKSLPYILSDAGFDVWLTNARGNYYSRGHLSKSPRCVNYWNFSWQEMGERDLPAVIDYIRQTKKISESINFVGHSLGTTALLVLLSSKPQYREYLRVGVLLAPLAYMTHIRGPLKAMTAVSEETIKLMGNGEFLPNRKVPNWLAAKHCTGPKIFCSNPLLFLSGYHQNWKWNASFVARLLYHIPAGTSANTLLHYMQVAHSGKFHRFNHPDQEFSLRNVTLPIALISSSDDWLASEADTLKLYFELANPIDHHIIKNMSMTHTDLVWGADANILVFDKVVEYLEKGLKWNMAKTNEV